MNQKSGVIDAEVPALTSGSKLVGGVAYDIRQGLLPPKRFVAPAEKAIRMGRIEAQNRTAEFLVSDKVRGIDHRCADHRYSRSR